MDGKGKRPTREEVHQIQIQEILKHKWIMSEKHGRDMGEEAVWDWIYKYAERFREYWEARLRGSGGK
jgi:hypothetical protein